MKVLKKLSRTIKIIKKTKSALEKLIELIREDSNVVKQNNMSYMR